MPLTGTFLADFTQFKTAVSQAEVSLKGLETGAGKVSTSLNRMVDSFSGRKMIQDATLMTEAINRIGGASVLTASEQKRVNDKVTEAIEKYRALGQQAPADMLKLADATKKVETAQGGFLDRLRATIPTSQSFLGQVQSMALGYVTGTAAIQGFEAATRAAFGFVVSSIKAYQDSEDATRRLTAALTAQGQATPATIAKFESLSKQYQQTTRYSDELIKESESLLTLTGKVMPSQMDEALKAVTNLAAGLRIDLGEATVMVAKGFEDNFTTLKKNRVAIDENRAAAEGMGYVLAQINRQFGGQAQSDARSYAGQLEQLKNQFDDLKEEIGKTVVSTGFLQIGMAVARAEITKTIGEIQAIVRTMGLLASLPGPIGLSFRTLGIGASEVAKGAGDLSAFAGGAGQSIESLNKVTSSYTQQLADARRAIAALTSEQRANLKAGIDMGVSTQDLQRTFGLTAQAINIYKDQLAASKRGNDDAKRAAKELADELERERKNLEEWANLLGQAANTSLATFIQKIGQATMSMPPHLIALQEITKAERELSPAVEDAARSMLEAGIKADRVFAALKAGKQVTDDDREAVDRLAQSVKEMGAAQDRWNEMLSRSTVGLGGLFKVLKDLGTQAEMSKPPTADYEKFRGAVGDLTRAFGLLAQISGDSWGGVVKDIATAVAAMQTALETVKAIEQAMQSMGVLKAKYNPSTGKMEPGTFGPVAQGVIGTSIVGYTVGSSVVGATDIRKGATGAAAGAAAGAGAGALYGSVVPGIGTGIGAAVGAIAGAIGGYLAARKAAKELRDANNEASKAIADMQKQLVSQYGPLQNIDKLGKQVGVDLAGAWGDQSIEGLKNFQALTTEFQEKVKALQDAVQEFGLTWKDLGKDQQLTAMQEQADKLVQKFDVLEKAGYDMGVVTAKSAGALLSLLGDIAEVGGKIPDNLAPAIARLGGLKTISDDNAAALNKYIGAAIGSGAKIPAALQPIIEKLIRMGKLTEENAKALLGMSSEALPALDDIKAAADRYGLSLEQVGGKAMQIQIATQAKQAVADWELLTSLGGNFGAVMAAMAPQVQSIVSDALKFGQQLPESMKPMIQAMIEAGQLTDETGQKLTDISQLDFAADPTKKTQELIDKLGGFIDVLTGGAGVTDNLKAMSGDAKEAFGGISDDAKKAADAIKKEFSGLSFTIPITYDFTNAGSPTGGATGYAAGGTVYARSGWPWTPKGSDTVPAMLTPGERVLSLAETAKYDSLMGGGSYRPTIVIQALDSKSFDEWMQRGGNARRLTEHIVPEIPGVVKRYGLTR